MMLTSDIDAVIIGKARASTTIFCNQAQLVVFPMYNHCRCMYVYWVCFAWWMVFKLQLVLAVGCLGSNGWQWMGSKAELATTAFTPGFGGVCKWLIRKKGEVMATQHVLEPKHLGRFGSIDLCSQLSTSGILVAFPLLLMWPQVVVACPLQHFVCCSSSLPPRNAHWFRCFFWIHHRAWCDGTTLRGE